MGDKGSVQGLAFERWGVRPTSAHARFTEPGWSYEERVGRACPRCAGALHSFRKPYERAGRTQRYVALVCPGCPATFTLADLGARKYDDVRQPVLSRAAQETSTASARPFRPSAAAGEDAQRALVLQFWRSVELFDAQKLDPPNPRERRYEVRPGQHLPWEAGHPLGREAMRKDLVWRHSVYGGVFELDRLHGTLERVFGDSGPDTDERAPRGNSALFAAAVTEDGRLLLGSLVLSTAAWAVGRVRRPGPGASGWLEGFDAAANQFVTAACEMVAAAEDDAVAQALAEEGVVVSRPVDQATLLALVSLAVGQLGVADVLAPAGLRVHSERVGRKRAHDVQVDFLNSFYMNDLAQVADAVADGDYGPALADFLTPNDALTRIRRRNVRDSDVQDALLEQLAPTRIPVGRWPAKVSHPLAASQQLAINAVMDRLGGPGGVFAVNGPPGTGKTTMLRDLVAAVVVDRAVRLTELPDPTAGFGEQRLAWRTEHCQRWIRPLRAELAGFEMVVASANNGAVANVTREIPQRKAIDDAWMDQAGYLSEHATRLLGEPAWGLVATRLGNKTNCNEFVGRFWYGNPADPSRKPGEEGPGFHEWLGTVGAGTNSCDWGSAVSAFRAAAAVERRIREARQAVHEALRQLSALEQASDVAERTWRTADNVWRAAQATAREADQAVVAASQVVQVARQRRQEHLAAKPGLWEMLFTLGKAIRRWHREDEPLAEAVRRTEAGLAAAASAAHAAGQAVANATHRAANAMTDRDRAVQALSAAQNLITEARREFGHSVPDVERQGEPIWRKTSGPWLDEEWNAARTLVFLAALDLHQAFIAGAASIMRGNLRTAMDVLTGQVPTGVSESVVRQAWQSLFLVVPVVSTTFASVSRLLGRLGREALGWLLIDEAGQAVPQAAVGAMWRAKRVVAVGDPLQLEPVVTVLHTTQVALARHHRVVDLWLPGRTSVQGLTDRVTALGTWLPGPDDNRVWVGAPLCVHRRCDNPMFDIVNTAVYAGLMVHATAPRSVSLSVRDSTWIDITASSADGHWIPAEGDATLQVLGYLEREGISPDQIMVISPFRDVARQLRRLLAAQYPQLVHGTVHTAQGKEAEVVLFVLGGNPAKPGARQWAASRPNLFNVAVSRAKQRLYVVGDHDNWAKLPYFSVLSRDLPVRLLRSEIRETAE
ncbi:DEAD/DEAH box helicase [Micromonospora polyrhachis]|uniref:AAA domain-containing protein n=1 Tax=Micromonospora polyrhachis TaxID=1282883 RepID=A0A7W7SKY4_9ACTN|nr:ATP-binding protein [Micromonospora polyrhachis]MBB4956556.1 hypothetical protein [Micromonospora polyrhachis]